MENVELKYKELCKLNTLTWIEYDLGIFSQAILERATSIVQPKETVSDFDKAAWFTSLIVLLGKMLPPNRFLFRIMEEESKFLIQLHDPAKFQQPQTIEVPYRKVFDWKIGSWEEAKRVPTKEERQNLFSYWKENGYSATDIANHFGTSSTILSRWTNSECCNLANGKRRNRDANHPANVATLLKRAGMKSVSDPLIAQACNCSLRTAGTATRRRVVDEGQFNEIDYERAIEYVNLIIYKLLFYSKSLGSGELDHRDRHIGKMVRVATGIIVTNKRSYNPAKQWSTPSIDQEKQKDAIVFLNNVLTNLNKMKGELK